MSIVEEVGSELVNGESLSPENSEPATPEAKKTNEIAKPFLCCY
jgi:hypothetical protein